MYLDLVSGAPVAVRFPPLDSTALNKSLSLSHALIVTQEGERHTAQSHKRSLPCCLAPHQPLADLQAEPSRVDTGLECTQVLVNKVPLG